MTSQNVRKPFRNFFIKKSLQIGILLKIAFAMILSTFLTTVILAWIYQNKSQGGTFYFMSNNIMEDLELQSILGIILPALITAQLISIMIVVGIGLFSSRKIAVPLYKVEQWARNLRSGNLSTYLQFRETDNLTELSQNCNSITSRFKQTLAEIKSATETLEKNSSGDMHNEVANRIKSAMNIWKW